MIFLKKKSFEKVIITLLSIIIISILVFYHIGYDLLLIILFFGSCWCAGDLIPINGNFLCRELIRLAIGMALVGLIINILLSLGWGGKTQYALIVIMFPMIRYFRCRNQAESKQLVIPKLSTSQTCLIVLLFIIVMLQIIYASAPISQCDAICGHLPITMFASRNGVFNNNIAESIVYYQTGVFTYSFSVFFASFGAYKALTIFNVFVYLFIFLGLCEFSRKLYLKTNLIILAIIFYSVPLFFSFATMFYVEMLPVFFAFSGFLLYADIEPKKCYEKLPIIGLLFGCSVISKLTISYTILVGGTVAIILVIMYIIREKSLTIRSVSKIIITGILFFLILAIPFGQAWYRYGNPFYPWFNDVFKSPYFPLKNFVDPFDSSPLGYNFNSLQTIILHSSKNIEMKDGALGYYLFLLPIIPIGCIIHRKRQVTIWSLVCFLSYGISTFFTFNLRYYMAIFMLASMLVAVSLCIICEKLRKFNMICMFSISILISIPGLIYIKSNYSWKDNLTKVSDSISVSAISSLLSKIPSNMKVFSSSDYKGDYDGYFSSNDWHGYAWKSIINKEGITIEEFISDFDYYICKVSDENEMQELGEIESSGLVILDELAQVNDYKLYHIKSLGKTIATEQFDKEFEISLENPYTVFIPVDNSNNYRIEQLIKNEQETPINMRFQINWLGKDDTYISTTIQNYTIAPGEVKSSYSDIFVPPNEACKAAVVFSPENPNSTVIISEYQFKEMVHYVLNITRIVENRQYFE